MEQAGLASLRPTARPGLNALIAKAEADLARMQAEIDAGRAQRKPSLAQKLLELLSVHGASAPPDITR